jgi:predicted glutamine amidotransferase
MCRLVGWVSRTPCTLSELLGPAALARLEHLSTVHADGWGAAWHDEAGGLATRHSPTRAGADRSFKTFAEEVPSTAALVHLRLGTPGFGVGMLSTHPFVEGSYAFGHNGAILPASSIDELLSGSGRTAKGPTDSERYFLALRDGMDRHGGSVAAAVGDVVSRIDEAGLHTSSLNAVLLGLDAVHVISRHDALWQAEDIPVWPADEVASAPAYFPLSWRRDESSVTVVSSGIVDVGVGSGWQDLPNDAVLRVATGSLETAIDSVWAVEDEGDRSVVDGLDPHVGPELTPLDPGASVG